MGRSRALPFLSCSSTPTISAANQTTTERSGDVIFNGAPIVLQVLFRTIGFLTEPNNERKKCALTEFRRFGFSRPRTITTGLALKYEAVRQIYLGASTTENGGFEKLFSDIWLSITPIFRLEPRSDRLPSIWRRSPGQNSKRRCKIPWSRRWL